MCCLSQPRMHVQGLIMGSNAMIFVVLWKRSFIKFKAAVFLCHLPVASWALISTAWSPGSFPWLPLLRIINLSVIKKIAKWHFHQLRRPLHFSLVWIGLQFKQLANCLVKCSCYFSTCLFFLMEGVTERMRHPAAGCSTVYKCTTHMDVNAFIRLI